MLNLKPLTLSDIPLLTQYLQQYPRSNCDYTVTNLISWGMIYEVQYTLWQDNLVIFNPKYQYIFFPLGENFQPAELPELVMLFRGSYPQAELILFPEEYTLQHPELANWFELTDDRSWADYVYPIDDLVRLSGKKLAKKKNLVSQFVRAYPDYKVLPITSDKRDVLLSFTQKWRRERSADGIYLMTELKAIENTFMLWDELPVEGIIICLHNRIAAYSVFSRQNPEMVTEHFEKFDPEKKGAAQLINWETARWLQPRFRYINREQDLGLEGLRQAKMSYQPSSLVKFLTGRLINK